MNWCRKLFVLSRFFLSLANQQSAVLLLLCSTYLMRLRQQFNSKFYLFILSFTFIVSAFVFCFPQIQELLVKTSRKWAKESFHGTWSLKSFSLCYCSVLCQLLGNLCYLSFICLWNRCFQPILDQHLNTSKLLHSMSGLSINGHLNRRTEQSWTP